MPARRRSPESLDWREIASLGEQLANATSLTVQRDRISSMTGRMIPGRVDVWLHESLFRLPDWEAPRAFPARPRLDGMRRALARRKVYMLRASKVTGSKKTVAAVPLEDQGLLLGAIQVTRSRGPEFTQDELNLLTSLASVVAVGLYASHRVEVERFRLGQLNLVSEVSAQIANVLQLDELARRVTELIQKTFHYYYVGIFTLQPGAKRLRFRSSASGPRAGRNKSVGGFEVDLGQGLVGEAAAVGERIVAPDVRRDPRYRFVEPLPKTRSEVVIPLKLENRVLGVLDVQSDRLNAFHPNDLLLLQALADNIARAVEGARLYGDLRRRAEQLTLVAEVSRSVNTTLELDKMMQEAAELIHGRFGYPYVSFFSVHPTRKLIEYEGGSGRRDPALTDYAIPLDESPGIIPWVARSGDSILANDVSKEPRYKPSPLPPKNTRSELCVPLWFGDRVLGVLDIQSDKLNAFTEDDRIMFETVAGTIAASMRNADLYRSEQWRRRAADSLREVAGLLSEYVGVEEALESILTELGRNLPVDVSAIWLFENDELYLASAKGADPATIEHARRHSPDAGRMLEAVMSASEPVIRKPSDPVWPLGQAAGFGANYSALGAPLRVSDQPVGLIALAHHSPGRYGHEAQAMTATFASYAAVAIENARLYDSVQEQAHVSAALLEVAHTVASLSDLDEIIQSIVHNLPAMADIRQAAFYLWDGNASQYVPSKQYGLGHAAQTALWNCPTDTGNFPLLDAARETSQLVAHSLGLEVGPESWIMLKPDPDLPAALRDSDRLLIAVPAAIKSDLFGLLLVEEREGARRYRPRRLQIVNGVAQQIALAIQSDRLQNEMVVRERLETEVNLARQIQATFIPQSLPQPAGWELAARWQTARQVGGDFYDVIELPGDQLGLFIADVADKGMPAALFMALTRTLVRAAVKEIRSPAAALRRVNDLLMPDTSQGMFVTAAYATLDLRTGALTYANAGHNAPLWVRGNRQVERLTRTGIALGIIESHAIAERTIRLAPGEGVLLYTDGITEAFSPSDELYGEQRLIEALVRAPAGTADAVLESIESSVRTFIDSRPLSDDMTMLLLRRT